MEFFLINLVFVLSSFWAYGTFRSGISAYCSLKKMSKSYIKKNKNGIRNYWLYQQLHRKNNLGGYYYLNCLFLICLTAFLLVFLFSWIEWMQLPVIIVGIVLGLVEVPAVFKALISINREDFGCPFVLFGLRRGFNGKSRYFATVFDWLFCVLPLAAYIQLLIIYFQK